MKNTGVNNLNMRLNKGTKESTGKAGASLHPALLLGTFLLVFAHWPAIGEYPLRDPLISDGETAIYKIEERDSQSHFTEQIHIRRENGKEIYDIAYITETETTEVKLEKKTMKPYYVHSVVKDNGITLENLTSVVVDSEVEYEDIMVLSFSDLKYSLRGYPFSNEKSSINISFLSTSDEDDSSFDFSITANLIEIEDKIIGDRTIPCYKLRLKMSASGIMRLMNSLMPKTFYWFSVESPHYLVAYEGASGFPGSPKSYIEIVDYSGWK